MSEQTSSRLVTYTVFLFSLGIIGISLVSMSFPALIINNLQIPLLFFLSHIIGAEGVEVFEYTADKGVNSLKTTTNKLYMLVFFT